MPALGPTRDALIGIGSEGTYFAIAITGDRALVKVQHRKERKHTHTIARWAFTGKKSTSKNEFSICTGSVVR